MKKFLLSVSVVLFSIFTTNAQSGSKGTSPAPNTGLPQIKWSVNPFEHALFVENKGQYDTVDAGGKILFEAKLGSINAFFTAKGILYRHIETDKLDFSDGNDPDQNGPPARHFYYLTTTWDGANPATTIVADEEQSYYYTYPNGTHETYTANVFKKITYQNIYPGVDIVYSFPEGSSNLKYTIVVHPGGDLSKVHLKYENSSNMQVDGSGNVLVKNDIGTLKEAAPVSYYMEDHKPVTVKSEVTSPEESFITASLDATKTLMVDPAINWTTNPNFTTSSGNDYAYDLDYDNLGNVYAYGGGPYPLQLVKLNSAGAIQWTFNATTMTSSTNFYGDFAVDKKSLECYVVEGWNAGGGARVEKVSSGGALMATDPGNSGFNEMWRVESTQCPSSFVTFGNGTCCPDQAAMLDTTMTTIVPANILSPVVTSGGYHDMALTASDPYGGSAWTATTQSLSFIGVENNYLIKVPLPALTPNNYNVPDGFAFHEIASIFYSGTTVFNAMNGLACGVNFLYAYNGDTVKQINKATGAIIKVAKVSATPYTWGGLDVDLCGNVYVGNNNAIQIYDANLNLTSTLPTLPGIIYDLAVGPYQGQLVYACGQNYVSEISLGPPLTSAITITKGPTTCSACSGVAKATLNLCGVPDTVGVTYRWSNGETTRTATGLCSGIDTVTITITCDYIYKDTVTIPTMSGGYNVVRDSVSATCANPGSASVTITGGKPPYTYLWGNGSTTSSTGPVGAGVYCLSMYDNAGCFDTLCITVTGSTLPTVSIAPNPDTICSGSSVTLTATGAGGTGPYVYLWNTGATTSSVSVSPITTTTYTATVTDANGCTNSTTSVVDVLPAPVVTITAPGDSICSGSSLLLTAAGGTTYNWAPGGSTNISISVTPTVTTTYTVIGSDAHNCTNAATFTVYVTEMPVLASIPNVSMCTGNSTTLIAHETTGTKGGYKWMPGGSTSQSITVSPSVTTTYTVCFSNPCGTICTTVTVNILPTPVPAFKADVMQGCAPLCIQFRDLSSIASGKISQWTWAFGNGDTADMETPIYCYPKSGDYTVTLTTTSDSGCSATLKVLDYIKVYTKPVANFVASPQPTTIMEPTIQFTDHSTDAYGIVYWNWNFGDNKDSLISTFGNPSHTYSDTGTYCVKLGVMNQHGCVDTMTDCLIIDPLFTLYIPDAFTPNENGINDVFMAKGNDVKTFEMYIFDRWGMQLFHSNDINVGWSGSVKGGGNIAQEDTYVYLINATDHKNTKHSYIGKVNLIK